MAALGVAGSRALARGKISLQTTGRRMLSTIRDNKTVVKAGGLLAFAQSSPFVFQVGVSTLKTSVADLMVHMAVENKSISEPKPCLARWILMIMMRRCGRSGYVKSTI